MGSAAHNGHQQIRVLLVSPHALPRLGLVRLLESIEGVQVVAHTAATTDGQRMADEYSPDVVLVDAELAADENMRVVDVLKKKAPPARVLLLAERASHMQVETALEAGADGYTLKDISVAELGTALRRLAAGDTVLHPEAASIVARRIAANGRERNGSLTPRQKEILRLLASGLENKQIARRLGIGVHTVKTHVSRVLAKMGASSRTEAVVLALRDRLIS
ncbi:MAG: response regulator transcription factor [Actinomycetota bacterium]